MGDNPSRESIDSQIVASGAGWRLERFEIRREPLCGAILREAPWERTRWVESGGFVYGTRDGVGVYGPGHEFETEPGEAVLYLPLGTERPAVEWSLAVERDRELAPEPPSVSRAEPERSPVELPYADRPDVASLYPDHLAEWVSLPTDVATWASCLDIRSTSLTQRLRRLAGTTPKSLLSGVRATLAVALADHYRGSGAELALDTGYSSQSHLSRDIKHRFGVSPSELTGDEHVENLAWTRLLRSSAR